MHQSLAGRSAEMLSAIHDRVSAAKLSEPGPGSDALEVILSAGVRAPDHGRLRPWRFIVIERDGRERFANLLGLAMRKRDPAADDAALERERAKALRAPVLVVVAAAVIWEHPKIPAIEQILAVGAAVQNMILASQALGFGTMWKTGALAYDPVVKEGLGLLPTDQIVAVLHLGTAEVSPAPRLPTLQGIVRYF